MNPERLLQHFERICEAPDAVPRLRRFILDLAVRGKLVEQDPNDEPAAELLKRIQAGKTWLVNEGEIKSFEEFDPIEMDAFSFAIPSGWEVSRMGSLALKLGAGSTPLGGKSVYRSEGVPFLRSQNIYNDGLRLDDVALIPRLIHEQMSGTHVQSQDILLNITGASIGRCALVPETFTEGNVSQHVAIIRLFDHELRDFIHLSLISPFFQKLIDYVQVGVSRAGLSMQRLRLFPMLIPPLAEQHRIVAKVDELMALCDQLEAAKTEREQSRDRLVAASLHRLNSPADTVETDAPDMPVRQADACRDHARFVFHHLPRLTTRPEHIKQLRQTILNLAVRGKLVPQDPNDESPIKRQYLFTSSLDLIPFPIPATWHWMTLKTLGRLKGGGTPSKDYPDYWNGEIPWVSPKDMKRDYIATAQFSISQEAIQRSAVSLIKPHSLLFVVRGMILAHSFPVALSTAPLTINQDMKALEFSEPEFGEYLLRAIKGLKPIILAKVQRSSHGTCRLEGKDYSNLPIPLPPLDEQHRIVTKVDELMALCDQLEAQLTTTETDNHRLLEAVLHEALQPSLEGV